MKKFILSRRTFMQTALAVLALPARKTSFLSVGICAPTNDHWLFQKHGYQYLEPTVQGFLIPEKPQSAFSAHLHALQKISLPIPVANSFLPSRLKVVGPDTNPEAVLTYAHTAFRRAQQVGIEHIVFGSGGARYIPDGFSHKQARKQFISLLKQMAPLATQFGITLCLEPLRQQETNFLNTVPEAVTITQEVGHPAVQLTFDIYHVLQEGRTASDVHLAGNTIYHCHIAENKDRAAPGVHGDNFIPFFAALKTIGYKGRISVECRWQNRETELPAAVLELSRQLATV